MDFAGLIGPFYTSFASKAEVEKSVNLYLERIESGAGRNQFAMYRSPGLSIFISTAFFNLKHTCRELLELNGHLFAVVDDTIYDFISDGSLHASQGPIANDGLPVSIDASVNSLFVVSAGVLYRINGGLLTTPTTPFTPASVSVISGLVICIAVGSATSGSNSYFFSTDDGQTWPALNNQTAEAYPNALVMSIVDHQELWLFGNRRTQVFTVGSDPNAPFDAVSAGVIEMGLTAPFAVAKLDNSIFWLGSNRDGDHMVWRANGYSPVRVSNHAVENAFRSYPGVPTDAIMSTYQLNGHSCLRLTFPSANQGLGATWEYDISTGQWTEIAWWNLALNRYERHRCAFFASAFGKIIGGDYKNGMLYEMSPDINTDFGYPIRWERRTPHLTQDGKRVQYKRFGVFMQTGVGLTSPLILNDQSQSAATVAAGILALEVAGLITVPQADTLSRIYFYEPYPAQVMPDPTILNSLGPLGFFDFGANPMIEMRYSNDGGSHFNAYKSRPIGRAGDTNTRIYWGGVGGLGWARDRVWEISGMAPVKTAITQGVFDGQVCLS